MKYLSIVIPAYNEENRIGETLSRIHSYFAGKKYDYEVIVVDDGSIDKTAQKAKDSDLAKAGIMRLISNDTNRGKGFSIKSGILSASGEYILFSDADLSTSIEEVDKLFGLINNGYDIVIGSRALKDSDVKVHQPWYREFMGKMFNLFVKSILLNEFHDTQCGFKLFKGNAARDIAGQMEVAGFCFDVEMLYLAKKKGYNVKEVGVVWNNSPESKVRLFHSSLTMFLDLLRIRTIHGKTKGKNR